MMFGLKSRARSILLVMALGVLLGLSMGAGSKPDSGLPSGWRQLEEELKAGRGPGLLNMDYSKIDLSLLAREHVDFLLTPALLVQEAISEDVVFTYPEE